MFNIYLEYCVIKVQLVKGNKKIFWFGAMKFDSKHFSSLSKKTKCI